jgi:hypothetical protein
MAELSCRLEFISDDEIQYKDCAGREATGRIDRSGLVWRTTEWLCRYLGDGRKCTRTEIELLGRHLHELAFDAAPHGGSESVRKSFEASFEAFVRRFSDEKTTRLRIELVFHQKAERLSQLPWEFLFKPNMSGSGEFLAGRSRLILTRHVPEHTPSNDMRGEQLHILAAYCHPPDQPTISSGKVVLDALRDLEASGSVVVEDMDNPTYDELRERYGQLRPQLLHLVAHGDEGGVLMQRPPDEIAQAESLRRSHMLAGEDDPGPVPQSKTVSADDLIAMFAEHPPELVFLQACRGDAKSREGVFSTAQRLVHGEVAAVVAMQYAIVDQDAQQFADHFYRTISDGRSIGEAVTAGRCALGERKGRKVHWDDPAFGTPVLYLQRDSDNPLVLKPQVEHERPPAIARQVVPEEPHKCPRCKRPTTEYFCAIVERPCTAAIAVNGSAVKRTSAGIAGIKPRLWVARPRMSSCHGFAARRRAGCERRSARVWNRADVRPLPGGRGPRAQVLPELRKPAGRAENGDAADAPGRAGVAHAPHGRRARSMVSPRCRPAERKPAG